MTIDDTVRVVEKLRPQEGDVLVVRVKDASKDECQYLSKRLDAWKKGAGLEKLGVLLIPDDMDVALLDEAKMAELGWVKKRENRGYEFL